MDRIWAPWRIGYVSKIGKTKGCVFCKILREKNDKKNYIFLRSKFCFAILNIYPYNNGHILVMPYRHVNDLTKMRKDERADLMALIDRSRKVLDKVLKPSGYNIGVNIGRWAGAGYPGHIHFHIVPRWKGDINFMPVTANVKIISQSLSTLYKRLREVAG